MGKTDSFSVRIDKRLRAVGDFLIKKHPNTLSHSWFYQEGLEKTIETAQNNGERIPEDVYGALLEINNEDITKYQKRGEHLIKLQKEIREKASHTIAGSPPAIPGLKPGYHWEKKKDERGKLVDVAVENGD